MIERNCDPCRNKADYCKCSMPQKSHCHCEAEARPCYDKHDRYDKPCYDRYDKPQCDEYDRYDKPQYDKYDRPCYDPPEQNPSCDSVMPGGWTSFRKVTAADEEVFYKAIRNLMGVIYRPLYVSTQVVAGINYLFVAQAKVINAQNCFIDIVTVRVFKATDGTITLGDIKSVRPE